MSRKTEEQAAEMKKQTIGVEVEMNSITREKAAKLAAEFFGTGRYEKAATGTSLGVHGTRADGNGNSKRMSALRDPTARNAKWSHRFLPMLTWRPCRN